MNTIHLQDKKVKQVLIEKIKLSSRLIIPNHQLMDMEINEYLDHTSDCFVSQLNAYFASRKTVRHTTNRIKIHATWFDMFKEKYFPKWILKKYPVKFNEFAYTETTNITKICPHIPLGKDQYTCISWIANDDNS